MSLYNLLYHIKKNENSGNIIEIFPKLRCLNLLSVFLINSLTTLQGYVILDLSKARYLSL